MEIRMFQNQDINGIADLINEIYHVERVGELTTIEELNQWFDEPGEEIRENTLVVLHEGKIIGYNALCHVKGDSSIHVYSYGTVHPDFRRKGIGTVLVRKSIEHLRGRAQKDKQKVIYDQMVRTNSKGQNELAQKLGLEKHTDLLSYKCNSLEDLEVTLPKGYSIIAPKLDDAADWALINNDAFSWRLSPDQLTVESVKYEFASSEFSEQFYLLCVNESGEKIGFVSSYISDESKGVISTIAVHRNYQGQGVGKALLREVMNRMKQAGITEIRLTVDTQNPTSAIKLYEAHGFAADKQIIEYIYTIHPTEEAI
ncbi:GNAT family N-acetyltransferase [Cytobacillus suaedae]|nr:GNAT family N-acetyltransferase [Cytobacillus suaedae]